MSQSTAESKAEPAFRQLCHLLSLSRTGKVQSAVDNLVLTTLCMDAKVGDGVDPNELALAVSTYFGVDLDVGDVRLAIETHLKAGRLQVHRQGGQQCVVLAPSVRASLTERIEQSAGLEAEVRDEWIAAAASIAPSNDPDRLWTALQRYLGDVFRQHGAEAVQLLDSRTVRREDQDNLLSLLDRAIRTAGCGSTLDESREAIRSFFRSPTSKRLRYMSELLDGTFTFFALTVSDSTAEYLKGQVPSLKLFLDTNVVLAVLGFQDNPLQAADVELLETIRNEKYPFKLYYHERTSKEILEILDAARNNLTKRHYTPALSRAFVQYFDSRGTGMGLERKFHALNAEREVDVEAFLARFNHVEDLLRDQGIHRYNQSGAELITEDKGSLIAEFRHFLDKRRRGVRPPRRYEALDHDITVWMYLQRQRRNTTSALRSGALLLSNDLSLQAFDRSFLMGSPQGKRVPTVVLPQHLLQILRPFERVTQDFDQRFLEIFAAPEFRTTQSDYGATASKVLSYLASFDGVSTETAVHILNDDLLMGRLKDVESTDDEFGELIESAVIEENRELLENLTAAEKRLSEAELASAEAARAAEEEKNAREAAEARAHAADAVAATSTDDAETARAALELTRQQKEQELVAAEDRARNEIRLREEMEGALAAEREQRKTAEQNAADVEHRRLIVTRLLVGLLSVALVAFVWFGPSWIDWPWFDKNESKRAIQVLASIAILGLGYALCEGRHRTAALTVVVAGALITLVSLL
jgi:hypothetical protein